MLLFGSVVRNNRFIFSDNNYIEKRKKHPRGHRTKCTRTKLFKEAKKIYSNGGRYRSAVLHLCYSILFLNSWRPSCAYQRSLYFMAIFMLHLSSVVNPIICLSFVESYRRGLSSILCYFCVMQVNKRAKRERITLKGIGNLP